jgi:hypothetical protein
VSITEALPFTLGPGSVCAVTCDSTIGLTRCIKPAGHSGYHRVEGLGTWVEWLKTPEPGNPGKERLDLKWPPEGFNPELLDPRFGNI